jgi:hypothetical protein
MAEDKFINNVIWLTSIKLSLNEVGLKVVDVEHSCKLLATVYAYGGGNSEFTSNLKLVADIKVAQELLNLKGGETPSIQFYVYERFFIEANEILKNNIKVMPSWAKEIFEYYNLKIPNKH